MEIRPYVVEQHFGSELADIEVEIGFMETRLNKQNERETQPNRTSPFSLTFFVKLVAKQTKGKMIVDVIKKSQHSFYELFRSPLRNLWDPTHRGVTRQEIYCILSTFKSFMGVSNPRPRPYDPQDVDPTTLRYDIHSSNVILINQITL